MKYYIAYGSNLNIEQMKRRCPTAEIVGTAELDGWRLLFRGSKTGAYLTIEKHKGSYVPVTIWAIQPEDEKSLDRYEGFPIFYYKRKIEVELKHTNRELDAFAYIMHEDRPIGVPSKYYMEVCMEGYDAFGFDRKPLLDAWLRSKEEVA